MCGKICGCGKFVVKNVVKIKHCQIETNICVVGGCSHMTSYAKGGGGVQQIMTIYDKGGRGGVANYDYV